MKPKTPNADGNRRTGSDQPADKVAAEKIGESRHAEQPLAPDAAPAAIKIMSQDKFELGSRVRKLFEAASDALPPVGADKP